jgi:hypothetical protein
MNAVQWWDRRMYWKPSLILPCPLTFLYLVCPVGPLIGKYCGTKTPSELRSSTGILSLTFHTDMAVAKDGFSARYYLVHQEPLESELPFENLCFVFPSELWVSSGKGLASWWHLSSMTGATSSCQLEINEKRISIHIGVHFFKKNSMSQESLLPRECLGPLKIPSGTIFFSLLCHKTEPL